jgi:PPOX class probable F420-dependent enzyme
MPFHLPDPASPSGASIARRLHDEPLIWLTTVDAKGVPQPVPVWFLWDEATATLLVYSRANAKRLTHIQRNSNVALHLEASDAREVIVITGKASVSSDDPPADQVLPYVEKYRDFFSRFQITPKQLAESVSVPLRIHPVTLRYARNMI